MSDRGSAVRQIGGMYAAGRCPVEWRRVGLQCRPEVCVGYAEGLLPHRAGIEVYLYGYLAGAATVGSHHSSLHLLCGHHGV